MAPEPGTVVPPLTVLGPELRETARRCDTFDFVGVDFGISTLYGGIVGCVTLCCDSCGGSVNNTGAPRASSGSYGGLIVSLDHELGTGCQGVKKTPVQTYTALHVRTYVRTYIRIYVQVLCWYLLQPTACNPTACDLLPATYRQPPFCPFNAVWGHAPPPSVAVYSQLCRWCWGWSWSYMARNNSVRSLQRIVHPF